jgi:putative ABC transport system permease protein
MDNEYFHIALDNLRHRKLRSLLTMIGIFIGIAAVVSLIGLGEGLRNAINSQFGFLGSDLLSITASGGFGPPGSGVINPLTEKELDKAKQVSGVKGAAGRLLESCKITFNRKTNFGYAVSIPNGDDRKIIEQVMGMKAEKGRTLKDGDKGVVFLGYDFMDKDQFGKPIMPGSKIKIQDKEFTVIGIMTKKGSFQLDRAITLNEDDARDLFNRKNSPKDYDMIAVKFNEGADVNKIKADIEKGLRKIRNVKEGEEDFAVQTPASVIATVNSIILGVQIFIYIIAAISILVGGIGIMNTMYTAVVERTKEIGIMKSIGAKNSTVFALFFIESGLLGIIGGSIGALLGFLFANGLALIGRLILGSGLISASISPALIGSALLFSFILGSFFGTVPAYRASRLNPVDALRFAK